MKVYVNLALRLDTEENYAQHIQWQQQGMFLEWTGIKDLLVFDLVSFEFMCV